MSSLNTDYDTKVTLETDNEPLSEELPFRILLLGDWSGRECPSAVSADLSKIHPVEIDRDNFDEVLKKLDVKVNLDFQGNNENVLSFRITEIDDFHPDKIFQNLSLFANLRDIRNRLLKANIFSEAADEVRSWFVNTKDNKAEESNRQSGSAIASKPAPTDLLDRILDQTTEHSDSTDRQTTETSELTTFIKKIVKPHLVQVNITEQSELLMIVDEITSDLMRRILHHPQFQALESAWRGIYFITKRIETSTNLKLHLLDISKDELLSDLKSSIELTRSNFYKALTQQSTGIIDKEPWAVICGNYAFSLKVDDVAALIRLTKIGSKINAPFISYIKPEMFGINSFETTDSLDDLNISDNSEESKLWTVIRTLPEASHLGLASQRILARLPYGERTNLTETFYFEEFTAQIQHNKFLWSNPIFPCALLLAQTFRENGWSMSKNFVQEIDGLPVYLYQVNNENVMKSFAEITLTQNDFENVLGEGLIPLISYKNSDKLQIPYFQSVSNLSMSLKGKWC